MRIALFSPYGNLPGADLIASNFIFLLASYLQQRKSDIVALQCDGCLERCSLDLTIASNQKRHCLSCMNAQKSLINWANLTSQSLSNFLVAEDLKKINQNFSDPIFLAENLPTAGIALLQEYLTKNSDNLNQTTKFQKTSLILSFAIRKIIAELKPKLFLTHSANDLLTGIAALVFADQGIIVANYQSSGQEELTLRTNKDPQTLRFNFYSANIEHFRSDPASWDDQLRDVIIQNVSFLGLQSNQLSFYI